MRITGFRDHDRSISCNGFVAFLCRSPKPLLLLLVFAHFAFGCHHRPESFPAYVSNTHGWVLQHTLYTTPPAELSAQKNDTGNAATSAAGSSDAAPAAPAGGFQARPIYVFQKPL